jgi:hypothetical protein
LASRASSAQDIPPPPPPFDPNQPGSPGGPPPGQTPQQAAQQQELNTAEREDSGRGFELVWVDAQLGYSHIDMQQFSQSTLQIQRASADGGAFSIGAGVRFVVLVLGARLRYNVLSSFDMWQINAEAGLKFPISKLDILIGLHGGYSFVGSLGDASVATNTAVPASTDAVTIRGFDAGLDFAVDYYLTSLFSVGAGIYGDALFLQRPPVPLPSNFASLPTQEQTAVKNDPVYQQSGSSAGLGLGIAARLALHFGL